MEHGENESHFGGGFNIRESSLNTSEFCTQEADSLKCSKAMPKSVVEVPQVLKVFSGVFIYIFRKKNKKSPKKLVQTG